MIEVHATAVVDRAARLGEGVHVGPWTIVGPGVEIGAGSRIGPHCVIDGETVLGEGCVLVAHAVVGTPPQDLKYRGEPTRLRLGARNTLREFVTIHRGTAGGGGLTEIGDDNLFMAQSHVAHDCRVGSGTVFANAATLAGHVVVGDAVTMGAFSAVHQFCRVGAHAFVGGFTVATQDVLPYMRTVGTRGHVTCYGPNRIGLARRGMPAPTIDALQGAFRMIRAPRGRTVEGLEAVREALGATPEVAELVDFALAARAGRGFHA